MKKLILVTALAVAASWLLHEARQPDPARGELENLPNSLAHYKKAGHGENPHSQAYIIDYANTVDAPRPPSPPEPPSPPGAIRTIPWKPGQAKAKAPTRKVGSPKSAPSWFPESDADESIKLKADSFGSRVVLGRLSASPDRARQDLREAVDREVTFWIAADVPTYWKVPAPAIDAMVQGRYVQEVTKDLTPDTPEVDGLYTLYRAGQKLDFSTARRAEIVGMYRHELATARMQRLGGGLALALIGLAVLSGYIKADEATKGYYTNRLRLAAAAGLGAAGVAVYRFLV
jgi:hypothetical protein